MLSFLCQPCTQLQTHKSLRCISASSPFSRSDKTQRKKTRRSTATAARGKEQTMAEQMITSESGKQQKFTVFAPFCSAVLAFHFGQFNPLCVGPAKMTEKKNKKKQKTSIWGLKEANLSSVVRSRWRYLKSIRLWLFFFLSLLPHSRSTETHPSPPPSLPPLRRTSPLTQIYLASSTPSARVSRSLPALLAPRSPSQQVAAVKSVSVAADTELSANNHFIP